VCTKLSDNLPEWPNPMFLVMIHLVSNGNIIFESLNLLQVLFTDVRHWEEMNDLIDRNGGSKSYTLQYSGSSAPLIRTNWTKCMSNYIFMGQ
jgi:hypothetical protein